MVEVNVLYRLRDLYRDIDRCLDMGDATGFSRASHELLDVLRRLRDLIDSTSVADIVSFAPPPQATGVA